MGAGVGVGVGVGAVMGPSTTYTPLKCTDRTVHYRTWSLTVRPRDEMEKKISGGFHLTLTSNGAIIFEVSQNLQIKSCVNRTTTEHIMSGDNLNDNMKIFMRKKLY